MDHTVRHPRFVFVNEIWCNYSLTQHLVARYVYIYYMESNNNYMFRHLLLAIFRLYTYLATKCCIRL